jgi:hypothetical protein
LLTDPYEDRSGRRSWPTRCQSIVGDSGGKTPQLARAIVGAEKVARVLAEIGRAGLAFAFDVLGAQAVVSCAVS